MPYQYEPELEIVKAHSSFFNGGYLSLKVGTYALNLEEGAVHIENHEYDPSYILKVGSKKGLGKAIIDENQAYYAYWSELAYNTFRTEIEETWETLIIKQRYPNLPFVDFDNYVREFYDYYNRGISVNRARTPEWLLYQDAEMQARYPVENLEQARRRQFRGR